MNPLGIYTPAPIQTCLAISNFSQNLVITKGESGSLEVSYKEMRLWRNSTPKS